MLASSGSGGNARGGTGGKASGASGVPGISGSAGAGGAFVLTSTAFAEGETIALKYRCRQANVSPPLSWTPGPPGTKSYAVTMLRAAVPHWALYDIPASVLSLPEDIAKLAEPPIPPGSKQVKPNVDGSTWFGYSGPCPSGTELRTYDFFVYALAAETLGGVTASSTILEADAAIRAESLARAALVGVGRATDR